MLIGSFIHFAMLFTKSYEDTFIYYFLLLTLASFFATYSYTRITRSFLLSFLIFLPEILLNFILLTSANFYHYFLLLGPLLIALFTSFTICIVKKKSMQSPC